VATVLSNLATGETNTATSTSQYRHSHTSSHKTTVLKHASRGLSVIAELLVFQSVNYINMPVNRLISMNVFR